MICTESLSSGRSEKTRQQHGNVSAVVLVGGAEFGDQVALLELKRGQDVGGVCERKQKVADSHLGRGPEREQKAEHDGMPHEPVEQRCSERLTWYLAPAERDEGL